MSTSPFNKFFIIYHKDKIQYDLVTYHHPEENRWEKQNYMYDYMNNELKVK